LAKTVTHEGVTAVSEFVVNYLFVGDPAAAVGLTAFSHPRSFIARMKERGIITTPRKSDRQRLRRQNYCRRFRQGTAQQANPIRNLSLLVGRHKTRCQSPL
jgi:hypothetical protein